jgi:hypothetical protein
LETRSLIGNRCTGLGRQSYTPDFVFEGIGCFLHAPASCNQFFDVRPKSRLGILGKRGEIQGPARLYPGNRVLKRSASMLAEVVSEAPKKLEGDINWPLNGTVVAMSARSR